MRDLDMERFRFRKKASNLCYILQLYCSFLPYIFSFNVHSLHYFEYPMSHCECYIPLFDIDIASHLFFHNVLTFWQMCAGGQPKSYIWAWASSVHTLTCGILRIRTHYHIWYWVGFVIINTLWLRW